MDEQEYLEMVDQMLAQATSDNEEVEFNEDVVRRLNDLCTETFERR